jgi:hypothetical protein
VKVVGIFDIGRLHAAPFRLLFLQVSTTAWTNSSYIKSLLPKDAVEEDPADEGA